MTADVVAQVRALQRECDRYRRALEKIATKGMEPGACDRESKPSRGCHCFLCISRLALDPPARRKS